MHNAFRSWLFFFFCLPFGMAGKEGFCIAIVGGAHVSKHFAYFIPACVPFFSFFERKKKAEQWGELCHRSYGKAIFSQCVLGLFNPLPMLCYASLISSSLFLYLPWDELGRKHPKGPLGLWILPPLPVPNICALESRRIYNPYFTLWQKRAGTKQKKWQMDLKRRGGGKGSRGETPNKEERATKTKNKKKKDVEKRSKRRRAQKYQVFLYLPFLRQTKETLHGPTKAQMDCFVGLCASCSSMRWERKKYILPHRLSPWDRMRPEQTVKKIKVSESSPSQPLTSALTLWLGGGFFLVRMNPVCPILSHLLRNEKMHGQSALGLSHPISAPHDHDITHKACMTPSCPTPSFSTSPPPPTTTHFWFK